MAVLSAVFQIRLEFPRPNFDWQAYAIVAFLLVFGYLPVACLIAALLVRETQVLDLGQHGWRFRSMFPFYRRSQNWIEPGGVAVVRCSRFFSRLQLYDDQDELVANMKIRTPLAERIAARYPQAQTSEK